MTEWATRMAHEADAEALAELARDTFVEAFGAQNELEHLEAHCEASFSPSIQAREIADAGLATVLFEDQDRLGGYAQVRRFSPKDVVDAGHAAELCRLYVKSSFHGRGVAQCLMKDVRKIAIDAGADALWLSVWEDNPRGIAFYRKYGFDVAGRHIFYVGSDPQQDLVMALKLRA